MPQISEDLSLTDGQKHYIDMYASTKCISEMAAELKVSFKSIFCYIHFNAIHRLFFEPVIRVYRFKKFIVFQEKGKDNKTIYNFTC